MIWFRFRLMIMLSTLTNPLIYFYTVIFLKSILFVLYAELFSICYLFGLFEDYSEELLIMNNSFNTSTPKDYMLNWKIPNNVYPYSNYTNMELDQIHKYYINLESFNNSQKDDGIIKEDFIKDQINKELYNTCTINNTRPHVRFVGKTEYEIIPENYYYGSDSDSETEYPYISSNIIKNK